MFPLGDYGGYYNLRNLQPKRLGGIRLVRRLGGQWASWASSRNALAANNTMHRSERVTCTDFEIGSF